MLKPLTCTKPVAQCELLVVDDQQAQLKSLQQLLTPMDDNEDTP